jgi:hypothetical protein
VKLKHLSALTEATDPADYRQLLDKASKTLGYGGLNVYDFDEHHPVGPDILAGIDLFNMEQDFEGSGDIHAKLEVIHKEIGAISVSVAGAQEAMEFLEGSHFEALTGVKEVLAGAKLITQGQEHFLESTKNAIKVFKLLNAMKDVVLKRKANTDAGEDEQFRASIAGAVMKQVKAKIVDFDR